MQRPKKRNQVTMRVTVSVPAGTSAAQARNEVRSLLRYGASYWLDHEDIKAIAVKPAKRS